MHSPRARLCLLFGVLAWVSAVPLPAQLYLGISRFDDAAPNTGGNVGDLRNAILQANANPGSNIQFFSGPTPQTIVLQAPLPIITASVLIDKALNGYIAVSGNNLHRIFFVDAPGGTVTIRDIELINGRAKGGDGGTGSGGGGLGAGGAVFANRGTVTAERVIFSGNTAVGGKGGDSLGVGGGGGGGLSGTGGTGMNYVVTMAPQADAGGGGGGGYRGAGGAAVTGAGGGGGILGAGGVGSNSGIYGTGGGGGAIGQGGAAIGATGGGGDPGGGGQGTSLSPSVPPTAGATNGGGGGGGYVATNSSGWRAAGFGGRFGGGGGGFGLGAGGDGGEFGGGGGNADAYGAAGRGGWGGGGGGTANHSRQGNAGSAGQGGFGGGGGGATALGSRAPGGSYGGAGGGSNDDIMSGGGGGGGLGGAVFVRANNGASFSMTDCSISGNTAQGGAGGAPIVASGAVAPGGGQGLGSAIFSQAGSLSFTGAGTISDTIVEDSAVGATSLTKSGAGTLVLSATNAYRGSTTIAGGTISAAVLAHPNNPSSIGSGSNVTLTGGTLEYTGSASVTTSKAFSFSSGTIGVTNAAATLELIGSLGGSGAFVKSGPGTVVFNSVATYLSNTSINGGTLEVGPFGGLGGQPGFSSVLNSGLLSFNLQDPAGTTFALPISGTGGVRTRGFNTLKLTGASTYTGDTLLQGGTLEVGHNTALGGFNGNYGTIRISAGTRLRAADAARTLPHPVQVLGDFGLGRLTNLSGPISLDAASVNISAFNIGAADADSVFSGAISGNALLLVTQGEGWGTGALVLQGNNSYTGGTEVRDLARLALTSDNSLGAAGGTLTLRGYLRLDNHLNGTRPLVVGSDTAEIETGGRTAAFGSLSGTGGFRLTLSGGGGLAVSSGTFNALLTGDGKLTKYGTGTLTLGAVNNFTGNMTIQGGVVLINSFLALGASNHEVRMEGGAIRSTDGVLYYGLPYNFVLAGNFSLGRNIALATAVVAVPSVTLTCDNPNGPADADNAFLSTISGSGALVIAAGPNGMGTGAVRFDSTSNTYAGGTTVNAGGRLRVFADGALGVAGTPVTLGTGGRLAVAGTITGTRPLSIQAGGGELEFSSNSATFASLDGTGPLTLTNGQLQVSSGTHSGGIAGTGSLVMTGSGTLTLSGAGTYSGGTSMQGGILGIGHNAALGTGTLTIGGGNIRAVNDFRYLANAVTVNASFTLGRVTFFDGNATFPSSGTITITGDNPDGPSNGDSGFRGPISGAAAITIASSGNGLGTGAIVFYGANSFTGALTVGAGARLGINSDSSLGGVSSTLTLRNGGKLRVDGTMSTSRTINLQTGGGELENNANSTFGNLSGPFPLIVSGGAGTGFSGTLNHAGAITHNGTGRLQINVGTLSGVFGGTGELFKGGTGTLTLAADNTHSGTTTVNAGTLVLSGQSASTAFAIATGAVLELATATDRAYTPSGGAVTFSGTGTLRKTGAGLARWNEPAATFALGAGSLIDVQAGTFGGGSFANEVWTNNFSGLTVASGAEFAGVEANVRVDALSGAGLIRSGFIGAGYSTFTFGVNNGSGSFSGVLADTVGAPGRFTKAGTGTQILTGTNTHTGGTVVQSGGTLQIANNGTAGSIVGSVDNAGTLAFRRSDSYAFAGAISGAGAVSHSGGTLTLSGASPASGTLSILSGRVILSGSYAGAFNATGRLSLAGGSIGSGSASSVIQPSGQVDGTGSILGSVANSGLITAGPGETLTFSGGAVTNAGGAVLRAIGGGTLHFAGATSLVNNGLIDRISGTISFPASFTNNGVLLDSSVVQVKSATRVGSVTTIKIQGYAAHSYRLQKSTDLSAATFVNVGSVQSGAGAELTFTDTDATAHAFYRVAVD